MTDQATRTHCPFNFGDWVEHNLIGACRFIAQIRVEPSVCWVLSKKREIEACPVHELMPHFPDGTVGVQIMVAVGKDGRWSCNPGVIEDPLVSFVTARVPVPPTPAVLLGEVTNAE